MNAAEKLGRAIRLVRVARDIKQGDLAKAAGMSAPQLCRYEKGRREPQPSCIVRLAGALNMSVPELLARAEEIAK